jgi:hypothetical protein
LYTPSVITAHLGRNISCGPDEDDGAGMELMTLGNWAEGGWTRGWLELCLELGFHLRDLLDPDLAEDEANSPFFKYTQFFQLSPK